jgi:predicted RNA binding protein YcfA (HicA-like mRNA interferase family)
VKQRDLIKKISKAGKAKGLVWSLVRQGGQHTLYQLGSTKVSVPRHSEINEMTAQSIMKDLEDTLGKGWWR